MIAFQSCMQSWLNMNGGGKLLLTPATMKNVIPTSWIVLRRCLSDKCNWLAMPPWCTSTPSCCSFRRRSLPPLYEYLRLDDPRFSWLDVLGMSASWSSSWSGPPSKRPIESGCAASSSCSCWLSSVKLWRSGLFNTDTTFWLASQNFLILHRGPQNNWMPFASVFIRINDRSIVDIKPRAFSITFSIVAGWLAVIPNAQLNVHAGMYHPNPLPQPYI